MDTPPFPSFTKLWHNKPYSAISLSRPELSAKGKIVAVTGGGSGIGAGIANAFAAAGSTQIALVGRTEEKLLMTKNAIETAFPGAKVLTVVADISHMDQINEGFSKIDQIFGKVDVFVNSAAFVPVSKAVLSPGLGVQDWWATFCTNTLGILYYVRAFANHAAAEACLLNISTAISHVRPFETGISAYAASKAAGNELLDYIAYENRKLHAVSVHPGLFESEMSRKGGHGGLDDGRLILFYGLPCIFEYQMLWTQN